MKISASDTKVRATELLLVTRGAKATIIWLRRCYRKIRSSHYDTGKTGVTIATDRSTNRENEINEARALTTEGFKETFHDVNEMKNFANENLENELRQLMMTGDGVTDSGSHA